MDYTPQQRVVPLRILTPSGWLTGGAHLPEKALLVDWLNRGVDWLRLTDVRLNAQVQHMAFFALRREAVHLIVPPASEPILEGHLPTEHRAPREVQVLLPFGVAHGVVQLTAGVRVSDFLRSRPSGFFVLEESRWIVRGDHGLEADQLPRVVLGTSQVLGVSDAHVS